VAKLQLNRQINGYDANLGSAAAGFPNPADGSGVSMWAGQYIGRTTSNAADFYASGPFRLGGREHELVLGGSLTNRHWKNRGWWDTGSYDKTVDNYYLWRGDVAAPAWGAMPDFTNDETTRERGLYATARWNLRDDLKLITGGRWSNYTNRAQQLRESGVFVPYVGLCTTSTTPTRPMPAIRASSSLSPPRTSRGARWTEQGKNYELGVKALPGRQAQCLGRGVPAGAGQLRPGNRRRDPHGAMAYRAVQGVTTRGYELEVSGQLAPAWQLQAGFRAWRDSRANACPRSRRPTSSASTAATGWAAASAA
jgi:outer membrane receptor for ferric coprogen and ferric-rhodotorulic acid